MLNTASGQAFSISIKSLGPASITSTSWPSSDNAADTALHVTSACNLELGSYLISLVLLGLVTMAIRRAHHLLYLMIGLGFPIYQVPGMVYRRGPFFGMAMPTRALPCIQSPAPI